MTMKFGELKSAKTLLLRIESCVRPNTNADVSLILKMLLLKRITCLKLCKISLLDALMRILSVMNIFKDTKSNKKLRTAQIFALH